MKSFFFFFNIVMYIKLVSWQFPQQMLCFCLCFFYSSYNYSSWDAVQNVKTESNHL